MLSEAKTRKNQDIVRNERLDGKRIVLPRAILVGGYDGNWKGWQVPEYGILEVDIAAMNAPGGDIIHQNDFHMLTKCMESTGSDASKLSLLKQALVSYCVDCNQAMMLLLQFARDSSRELALILMFAVLTDRHNIFLCHAALSDRSKFNLHKRLGPLYMTNKSDAGGKYWFDLSKGDDHKALQQLLEIRRADPTARFREVRYAAQHDQLPLEVEPGSETWHSLFSHVATDASGAPAPTIKHGILELSLDAAKRGEGLQTLFAKAAQSRKAHQTTKKMDVAANLSHTMPARGSTSGGVPADVLTIDSRPNTSARP